MNDLEPPAAGEDYRQSHLQRGGTYDDTLAAAPFDAYMARVENDFLVSVVPALFTEEKPRYLDFACGTARITRTVAPLCRESIGVDVSPTMLEQARRKCPGVQFIEVDLTRAQRDLGQFDLATAFRFFGNAGDELRESVLVALERLVRPGGYLIVNSHRNPHSLAALLQSATGGSGGMDLHYFKLRRLLRRHGFRIEKVRPIGAWMYRARMLATPQPARRAERLERRFGLPVFAPIAPDVVIVARRVEKLATR